MGKKSEGMPQPKPQLGPVWTMVVWEVWGSEREP